jgi:hypothetical protein
MRGRKENSQQGKKHMTKQQQPNSKFVMRVQTERNERKENIQNKVSI